MPFAAPESDLAPAGGARTAFGDPILGATPATGRVAQDIGDAIMSGMQDTGLGRLKRGGQEPEHTLDENSPWYHRLARGVGALAADAPVMVAGAIAGGAAGTAVAPGPGSIVGAGAGGFAAPMALRDGVIAAYNHNTALSWGGVWDIAMASIKGGAKGAVIGGVTAGAGGVAGKLIGATAAPVVRGTGVVASELTAMTATSALVEQHVPTWQDFMDNAILLGGLKGAVGIAKSMRSTWAETGRTPEQVRGDAQADPTILADLTNPRARPEFTMTDEGPTLKHGEVSVEEPKAWDALGVTAHESTIKFKGEDAGYVSLTWEGSQVTDLHNVRVFERLQEQGIGSKVLSAILEHNAPDTELYLHNVQEGHAREWWTNRGAKVFKTEVGEDGTITRADFEAAKSARLGSDAEGGSRSAGAAGSEGAGQRAGALPQSYRPLALEERIKAAVEKDPRPELISKAFLASEGGAKLDRTDAPSLVKWDYVVDTDTAKGVLHTVTEHFQKEIDTQRRGVVSHEQSALDGLKLIASGEVTAHLVGQAYNSAQMRAAAYMLHDAANNAARLAEKMRGTPELERTPADKLALYASVEKVAMLNAEFAGARAESGRAQNVLRDIKRDPSLSDQAAALIKEIEREGPMQDIARLVGKLEDPAQMAKFAKDFVKAGTMEKVIEAWKAGIFSGPQTVQANVIGNVGRFAIEVPEATIRASLAAAGAALTGNPMSYAQFKARAFAPINGLLLATQDGLKLSKAALDTINEGGLTGAVDVLKAANKAIGSNSDPGKLEQFRQANTGAFGELVQIPFKILKLTDMPFRNIGERAEAYIMAVDRVAKDKLHPETKEGREALAKYLDDPTLGLNAEEALAATKRIEDAGSTAVFSDRLGPKMEAVQRAMQGTVFQFVVPVIRTPANLVSWALQHVPGLNLMSGRWRADFAAGGERTAAAVARVVTGTALTVTAMSLAEQGILTGGGLFEKEDSGTKRAAGWQPYSFHHEGTYYGLQRIEPVAKVLGLSADIYELMKAYKGQPDEQTKLAAMSVFMFANATISTTYLSGLANTMQAGLDPDRYLTNFLEQYASSAVPKVVGQTVTLNDPYQREVDGVFQAIQSQLPFLREKLLPKRDVWGEKVQRESLLDIMPVNVTREAKEKVRTEAMRLSLAIVDAPKFMEEKGPFEPKDKRIKLEGSERNLLRELSGKYAMDILGPIVSDPSWDKKADYIQASTYRKVIMAERERAAWEVLPPNDPRRETLRAKLLSRIDREINEAETGTKPDNGRRLPFNDAGQPQESGGRRLKFGGAQ